MFGHNRWRYIAVDLESEADAEKSLHREQQLVDMYRASLAGVDPALAVKSIRMRFQDRERTMYYLFLTTHDPTGALKMNKLLWDAKLTENELRWQLRQVRIFGGKQLSFFDMSAPATQDQPEERPTKEEIADHIYELVHGQRLTLSDVYKLLADEFYFITEVNSAVRLLRKQNRLRFTGNLGNRTALTFQ